MEAAPTGNILVVQCIRDWPLRTTVLDHTESFRRHSSRRCFYLNLPAHDPAQLPPDLRFDLILFDTTFVGARWAPDFFASLRRLVEPLRERASVAAVLPQDEFIHADVLCAFIEDLGIDWVFPVSPENEWDLIYPGIRKRGVHLHRVLTGYLERSTVARIEQLRAAAGARTIDVGYRAKAVAPWLGVWGQLKPGLATALTSAGAQGLSIDVSTRADDTLIGDAWFEFLLRCRYTIGVEGGASILDRDGSLKAATERFLESHPDAPFEEIEQACFPGRDGEIHLVALSPRHLEACATRTAQLLIEGDYNGVLTPGVHYVPLRRDLANLDEALEQVRSGVDPVEMTERAYEDVVASERFIYEAFVEEVESRALAGFPGQVTSPDSEQRLAQHGRQERRARRRARLRSEAALFALRRLPAPVVERLRRLEGHRS